MFETNFDNCFGPLHCVCRTKIPWQRQRESLPFDQSQSKEIGHCMQIGTPLIFYSGHHRVHRVATAAFWRTCSDEGKIGPSWWGWGVHAHPVTITYKVAVYASAERADTLPLFHFYSYMYSVNPTTETVPPLPWWAAGHWSQRWARIPAPRDSGPSPSAASSPGQPSAGSADERQNLVIFPGERQSFIWTPKSLHRHPGDCQVVKLYSVGFSCRKPTAFFH